MHQTCSFFVWKLQLMKHDSEPVDPPARLLLPAVSSLVSRETVTRQVMASSNSWRGSKGHVTAASGPISIPKRLRVVWYWITLIRSLPFSQRHLHCNLTFVFESRRSFSSSSRRRVKQRLQAVKSTPSDYISCIWSRHVDTECSSTDVDILDPHRTRAVD